MTINENYVVDVVKLLNLEIEEKFSLENVKGTFKFSGKHLLRRQEENGAWEISNEFFLDILTGVHKIIKKEWMPEPHEKFYYIDRTGAVHHSFIEPWYITDALKIRTGNYFKTREEAMNNVGAWLKYINEKPDKSWRKSELKNVETNNTNYIRQVASILGVSIGEEFDIVYENGLSTGRQPYHFTESNLVNSWGVKESNTLAFLIEGICRISKKKNWS